MEDIRQQQIEVMNTLCEYIPRLIKGIDDVQVFFEQGNEQKGYETVTQVLDGYNWVLEAMQLTNSLNAEAIDLEAVVEPVSELLDGFENKDTLLITDILVYEIKQQLERWVKVLQSTLEQHSL